MSDLNDKLLEIKRQKDEYILPENLKKDVTVYGVTGTYEGSGGSGDVKLFETVEEMQQDENPQDGDLAVVYREELTGIDGDSEFDSCTFPNEVILSEAFTDNIYGSFRSTESSYFDGMVDMSSSGFSFNGYGDSEEIQIQYSSQDGITYIRVDGGTEQIEFGTTIKWSRYGDTFNSVIGNFMKIGGNYYDGFYQCNLIDRDVFMGYEATHYIIEDNVKKHNLVNYIFNETDTLAIKNAIYAINNGEVQSSFSVSGNWIIYKDLDTGLIYLVRHQSIMAVCVAENRAIACLYNLYTSVPSGANSQPYWVVNPTTGNVSDQMSATKTVVNTPENKYCLTYFQDMTHIAVTRILVFTNSGEVTGFSQTNSVLYLVDYCNPTSLDVEPTAQKLKYLPAKSQIDVTKDYVYEKIFYGKDGVETGTLTTEISNTFTDINAEIYIKVKKYYNTLTPRILTDNNKTVDKNIKVIPCKDDGTSLYNTSSVTNMQGIFTGCSSLMEILQLDTSNVTNMQNMFTNCSSLTSIPLLNTSNVTNMKNMFVGCSSITEIPLLDTSNVTDMQNIFSGCSSLITVPVLNTSNVTNTGSMFSGCSLITVIPLINTNKVTYMGGMFSSCSSLTTMPLLDTSNVTNMFYMFERCSALTTVPVLNTSSVTNMQGMFSGCSALNSTSLDNILAMCTNATSVTSNKTLNYIGLTSAQATVCQSLSNYSAFTAAGWTTGY